MKPFPYILRSFLLLSILFHFTSCEEKIGAPLAGTLTGRIIDKDTFEPLEGVRITTNPFSQVAETDSLGAFVIDDIHVGAYNVIAVKGGYRSESVNIEILFEETMNIEMILERSISTDEAPAFGSTFFPAENATVSNINVTFSWQMVNHGYDSTFFDLTIYEAGAFNNPTTFENITDTFLLISNLKFETFYYWQLHARNNKGEAFTEIRQFRTRAFPDNQILFSRIIDGNSQLFVSDTIDTVSNTVQITHLPHHNWNPRMNRQRTAIVFESTRDLTPALFLMNIDGSGTRKLTHFGIGGFFHNKIEFDWAPNGSHIVFTSFNKLYRVDASGSGLQVLATAPEGKNFREVVYTPDGSRIITILTGSVANDRQIISMTPNGINWETLYDNTEYPIAHLDVHPDNNRILFSIDLSGFLHDSGRMLDANIHELNISTGAVTKISKDKPEGTNDIMARYSPDGGKIVFVHGLNTLTARRSVWMSNRDGSRRTQLFIDGSFPHWFE